MDVKKWKILKDFKIEKLKKDQILILLLVGILLLVIAVPTGKVRKNGETGLKETDAESTLTDTFTESEYVTYLEHHLENTLSQMEGAGDVTVMITLAASSEKVVEKDIEGDSETIMESDSQGGTRDTQNTSHGEVTVYDNHGNDNQTPYVRKEITPKVEGVVVLASGGDKPIVEKNITEAVQALFGIDTHKIRIVKKNQNMGEE